MTALYNEFEPKAAQWMRNLIAAGHIANGVVDERSIAGLRADDVSGHGQRHFFAGIGGWAYALRLAGVSDDADVWTGSCPCQPFSSAGRGAGTADPRHLWPEWFRLIAECRPAIVLGEQVASKAGLGWLDAVFADLEGAGYACAAADLCAAGVGAPHIRQRLYFVAHADGESGRLLAQEWQSRRADVEAERVVDAVGEQRKRSAGARREERRGAQHRGAAGSVVNSARGGWIESVGRVRSRKSDADLASKTGALADRSGSRLEVVREQSARGKLEAAERGGAVDWSSAHWIPCSDGKSRPVEPGTHPLAHGVSGRVGLLRGYGNAIVPAQAAAFVVAALESIR